MKSIVISLKTATARREHILTEFGKQNIQFEFLDALTPDLATPLAHTMKLDFKDGFLTSGELACFMSHVSLWKKMVDENIPYMAIFEDDVFLGEKADEVLNSSDWIQNTWDIIKLEAFSQYVLHDKKGSNLKIGRTLHRLRGRHVGAAGYILSYKAASYLIDLIQKNTVAEPLDHILFDPIYHPNIELLQMQPALCIQSYLLEDARQFGSGLENERVERRFNESQQRSLSMKIKRELRRFYLNLHNVFLKKKVTFK